MDASELKKLVKVCQQLGVLELETKDIKIKLDRTAMKPRRSLVKELNKLNEMSKPDESSNFTDEDVLFWSANSPGLNEGEQ